MVENQLLAVSNLNDSNSMSKTDDSSFTQHQIPFQKILVFSLEKKTFFLWDLDGMNQANSYGEHYFEDRDMSIILERKQLIFGRIEPQ